MRDLVNCHLTPGGEIEKRKAFVEAFDTGEILARSLMHVGNTLYVVLPDGAAARPNQTYGNFALQFLQLPTPATPWGTAPVEVFSWEVFNDRIFLSCGSDGLFFTESKVFYQDAPGSTTMTEVLNVPGSNFLTYKGKMYSCSGSNIYFSTVGDPTDWATTANGAGSIEAGANDGEAVTLNGIEVYYQRLAFFGEEVVQIWNMDPDPLNNIQEQTIRASGSAAGQTARQFGAGDVLYLANDGIRSLEARDSSSAASVSDIGSPIDRQMVDLIRDRTVRPSGVIDTNTNLKEVQVSTEGETGRFWLMWEDQIWVLSYFPGPRVTAWSRYLPSHTGDTAFIADDIEDVAGVMFVCGFPPGGVDPISGGDDRSNFDQSKIYAYGGDDKATYDACTVTVETPHIDMGAPAVWKNFLAFDAACDGDWNVEVSFDPDNLVWETIGLASGSTYSGQTFGARGYGICVGMRLTTTSASAARLANLCVHYNLSKTA